MRIILNALEKQSIHAQIKGRNDLTVDDKKFSGMAWLEDEDKYLIHGTLMIDLDLSILSKCLTPDISKFIGKGIKSVKSRVTNLKKLNPNLTVEKMRDSLVQVFKEAYQNSTIIVHDVLANELNTFKMLMDESWIVV